MTVAVTELSAEDTVLATVAVTSYFARTGQVCQETNQLCVGFTLFRGEERILNLACG